MHDQPIRRLTAVLFADIIGYTALMQADEEQALVQLSRFKQEMEARVSAYRGQIVQFYGDGCLAVFTSSVDAVDCARSSQLSFLSEPSVPVRMGLHVGEVVHRDGNVYGDAVNIASRIESMGVPGAVLLSSSVRHQIRNKNSFELVSLGRFGFKNVEEDMTVYALANDGLPVPTRRELAGKQRSPADRPSQGRLFAALIGLLIVTGLGLYAGGVFKGHQVTERSIAVLPFNDFSEQVGENAYLVNGIHEAVLNHLSTVSDLRVKSRSSVESYRTERPALSQMAEELQVANLLTGSVQRSENNIRVSVQLIDAATGDQFWTAHYDRELIDLFALQRDIARKIARELDVQLSPQQSERMVGNAPVSFAAYDLYLRGREYHRKFDQAGRRLEDLENAKSLYARAIQEDPEFALGQVAMGWIYMSEHFWKNLKSETRLDSVRIFYEKALTLDHDSYGPYLLKGVYWFLIKGDNDVALEALQEALQLNPNEPAIHSQLAHVYRRQDQPAQALVHLQSMAPLISRQELSRLYERLCWLFLDVCDFTQAREYARRSLEVDSSNVTSFIPWILSYTVRGEFEQELALARRFGQVAPEHPAAVFALAHAHKDVKNFVESKSYYDRLYNQAEVLPGIEVHNSRHRYGYVLQQLGQTAEGRRQIEMQREVYLKIVNANSGQMDGPAYDLAAIYAYLGDRQEALRWLRQWAHSFNGWGSPYYIEVDELFAPLRNDPELQEIVKKVQERKARQREEIRQMAITRPDS